MLTSGHHTHEHTHGTITFLFLFDTKETVPIYCTYLLPGKIIPYTVLYFFVLGSHVAQGGLELAMESRPGLKFYLPASFPSAGLQLAHHYSYSARCVTCDF